MNEPARFFATDLPQPVQTRLAVDSVRRDWMRVDLALSAELLWAPDLLFPLDLPLLH